MWGKIVQCSKNEIPHVGHDCNVNNVASCMKIFTCNFPTSLSIIEAEYRVLCMKRYLHHSSLPPCNKSVNATLVSHLYHNITKCWCGSIGKGKEWQVQRGAQVCCLICSCRRSSKTNPLKITTKKWNRFQRARLAPCNSAQKLQTNFAYMQSLNHLTEFAHISGALFELLWSAILMLIHALYALWFCPVWPKILAVQIFGNFVSKQER